jgi:hypothetical protein
MGSEIQPGVKRAPKREVHINYVTYLLITSFIPSVKKYALGVFKWNWKSFLHFFSKVFLRILGIFLNNVMLD